MKWKFVVPGIPEEYFISEGNSMTKEEIRTITLSKSRIKEESTVYDIGAGNGCISIEAALLAKRGKIFSIEKKPSRIEIIKANAKRFNVKNMEVIEGEAPYALENLPEADRIIIGGTGGKLREILFKCNEKLKDEGIVVINAVTIDTLKDAVSSLEDLKFNFNITQVSINRAEKIGKNKIMKALNPVWIIDARKEEKD
ncbi:MAG: precorrin-6Y C5,15-methyltransferase (decarboxylating) subunit CbiT [Candidatus Hydrothermarchaeota archaeon]